MMCVIDVSFKVLTNSHYGLWSESTSELDLGDSNNCQTPTPTTRYNFDPVTKHCQPFLYKVQVLCYLV